MDELHALFTEHVATSLLKQEAVDAEVTGQGWEADLSAGSIWFANGFTCRVQVLGSESDISQTWLWAWANTASRLPAFVFEDAVTLRKLGEARGIPELTRPTLPRESCRGDHLALIASGVCAADGYYRGPNGHGNGSLYFLLYDTPKAYPPHPARIVTMISRVANEYPVDHRSMATAFLKQQGFTILDVMGDIEAVRPDGAVIELSFDAQHRLSTMEGQILPVALARTGS
ncbi:MAG: DUF6882 domain-containing protein [Capsulimonadaceae bacterium]